MDIDPDKALAALEELEAENERRLNAKIEAGEALRIELTFVGASFEETQASVEAAWERKTEELRASGEKRPIYFDMIQVVVPRAPESCSPTASSSTSEPASLRLHEEPVASAAKSVPTCQAASQRETHLWVTMRPATNNGDPGEIAEGFYSVEDGAVVLRDRTHRHITTRALHEGQNPADLARQLLACGRSFANLPRPRSAILSDLAALSTSTSREGACPTGGHTRQ
jgi:hypothetical protein